MTGQARLTASPSGYRRTRRRGERYNAARRKVKATFLFASKSGVTPKAAEGLTADGRELPCRGPALRRRFTTIVAPDGMVGCVIPSAIAFGAGGQFLFAELTRRSAVASLYDFENRRKLFPAVHSRQKFCLLTLVGKALRSPRPGTAFFLLDPAELDDPETVFTLTPAEIEAINPNSKTLPIFRRRRDAALTSEIYQRIPVLWDEHKTDGNPWGITPKHLFNMTDDSDLFRTREDLEGAAGSWTGTSLSRTASGCCRCTRRRWWTISTTGRRRGEERDGGQRQNQPSYLTEEKQDPSRYAEPLSWIAEDGLIPTVRNGRTLRFLVYPSDWRKSSGIGTGSAAGAMSRRPTDERTAIPAFIPRSAAGHTFPLMLPRVPAPQAAALIAAQCSLVFDYVSRQKVGGIT